MIPIIVAIIAVVAVFCAIAGIYNNMVTLNSRVDDAWKGVDVQLQHRGDLILGLVETALSCEGLDRAVIAAVLAAHNSFVSATSGEEKIAADGALSTALEALFAAADQQPELAANTLFRQRRAALMGMGGKLVQAREAYNECVLRYNNAIQTFPGNIFAGIFQFKERAEVEAVEAVHPGRSEA